jgi:hypothetical protein
MPEAESSDAGYPTAQFDGFTIGMFVGYANAGCLGPCARRGIASLIWETGDPEYFAAASYVE